MQLIIAIIIDLIVGDPRVNYHPVRLIGKFANICEIRIRKTKIKEINQGIIAGLTVIFVTTIVAAILLTISANISYGLFWIVGIIIIWFSLSIKDLNQHAKNVYDALDENNIELARKRVSLLVSRDTSEMTEEEIIKSCIESVSENFADSIVAPIFYATIFGPIGAIAFRAVNTLDAMWGYKNEKYKNFGTFVAKLDDLLGFIPARLGAFLLCANAAFSGMSFYKCRAIIKRDCIKHPSPNSGYCEVAMAASLNIQLGGNAKYNGKVEERGTLGDANETIDKEKILVSLQIIYMTVAYLLVAMIPVYILKSIII